MSGVSAQELERRRPHDIRAALRLDRRCGGSEMPILLAIPPVVVIGVMLDVSVVIAGVMGATIPRLLEPWRLDETERGAHLRRVLPLSRRSVVAARYA